MSPSLNVQSYDKLTINANKVLDLPGIEGAGSIIHDVSKYHNNGTINLPTWTQLGSGLWVLDFDGSDDYVDMETVIEPTVRTLELWFNADNGNTGVLEASSNFNGAPNEKGRGLRFSGVGTLEIAAASGIGGREYCNAVVTYSVWHHAVFIHDATDIYLFIDGVQVATAGCVGYTPNTTNFKFGTLPAGQSPFGGYMALERIYEVAIDSTDPMAHYQKEKSLFGL